MAVDGSAAILLEVAKHRPTFMVYPSRDNYVMFARDMLERFEQGDMDEIDFRRRLCALSVCEIASG